MKKQHRVVLIGLDCATPQLMFDRFADDMPTLTRLRADALWGPMESVVPPITVPAWACMMSGQTPGDLGVYGFRDRGAYDYSPLEFANSGKILQPRIWDTLSAAGRPSIALGVPGTYPPSPIKGHLLTSHDWDFFSFVDMGPDRLHHGFWKYCDPAHPRFEDGTAFAHAFRDYYRALDSQLARFLAQVPSKSR